MENYSLRNMYKCKTVLYDQLWDKNLSIKVTCKTLNFNGERLYQGFN